MVSQCESEASIDNGTESGCCRLRPLPQRLGDGGFIIAKFPPGVAAQRGTKCGSFRRRLWISKYCGIPQLHVDLNQDQTAQQKSRIARCVFSKKPLGLYVMGRLRIRRVQKQIRVSR